MKDKKTRDEILDEQPEVADAKIYPPQDEEIANTDEDGGRLKSKGHGYVSVACAKLNVRLSPEKLADNSNVVLALSQGERRHVLDYVTDDAGTAWLKIKEGYIMAAYVQ